MNSIRLRAIGLAVMLHLALAQTGCEEPFSADQFSLTRPVAVALVCQKESGNGTYQAVQLDDCSTDATGRRLLAFIANGPGGDVGILDLTDGEAVDQDVMVPGFTRLYLGGYAGDLVASADSKLVYLLDPMNEELVVLSTVTLESHRLALPAKPARIVMDEVQDALFVSFTSGGFVAKLALDHAGEPGEADKLLVGGSPSALAVGESTLLVGHLKHQFVTPVDLATMLAGEPIGLVQACRDGLDNDEDGLIDSEDPGCLDPTDNDESDVPDVMAECGNGTDDDGDGLVDLADAGCRHRGDSTEHTDNAACNDLVDNDLDGEVDEAGEGGDDCVPEAMAGEAGTAHPCSDGKDNDGDGLADYSNDPDCFAAGWTSEWGVPAAAAEVALSPDGKWAYVGHAGLESVVVLDMEKQALLDVHAGAEPTVAQLLRQRRNEYAIELSARPAAITFHDEDSGTYAYVSDAVGMTGKLVVQEEGLPQHVYAVDEENSAESLAGKPKLFFGGDEVLLSFSPAVGYPNIGPLIVQNDPDDADKKIHYGISLSDDVETHENENWYVTYEGVLPGTAALRARVQSGLDIAVIGGELCELGVLPGDYFVVEFDEQAPCADYEAGVDYSFVIDEVGGDWIRLAPSGPYELPSGTEIENPELVPSCFAEPTEFSIRPPEVFVVRGSTSGYLHNVADTEDGCRAVEGPVSFVGRADAAVVKKDMVPSGCPITDKNAEFLQLSTFANPVFSMNIFPGCEETEDGAVELVESQRDTIWRFAVVSGVAVRRIVVGRLAVDQVLMPAQGILYVLDLAERGLKSILLDTFEKESGYY